MRIGTPIYGLLITAISQALFLTTSTWANVSGIAWQQPARQYRILLDWRSDDRRNLNEPTELFLDIAKLSATTDSRTLDPASFTFIAENSDGSFQKMPFAFRDEIGQFNRLGIAFRFVAPPK